VDMDGYDEIFLQNGEVQAIIMGDGSASICELDAYRLSHNFADTLSRQAEHYHRKVGLNQNSGEQAGGIANPHERVTFKHEILPEDMVTDAHRRTLFLDRLLPDAGGERMLKYQAATGHMNEAKVGFVSVQPEGAVAKHIELQDNNITVTYRFDGTHSGQFEIELNLAMPSCDGPAGCFRVGGEITGGFGQAHKYLQCSEIELLDEVLGGSLTLSSSHPASVRSAPCFSVSQSEAGFEKIMQAVTLHLSWPMAEIKQGLTVTLQVK
jgi:hypothetical protein